MNKMYLIGSYNKATLKVNESAKKEYERLRSEGLFKSHSHLAVTETSITIILLILLMPCILTTVIINSKVLLMVCQMT